MKSKVRVPIRSKINSSYTNTVLLRSILILSSYLRLWCSNYFLLKTHTMEFSSTKHFSQIVKCFSQKFAWWVNDSFNCSVFQWYLTEFAFHLLRQNPIFTMYHITLICQKIRYTNTQNYLYFCFKQISVFLRLVYCSQNKIMGAVLQIVSIHKRLARTRIINTLTCYLCLVPTPRDTGERVLTCPSTLHVTTSR